MRTKSAVVALSILLSVAAFALPTGAQAAQTAAEKGASDAAAAIAAADAREPEADVAALVRQRFAGTLGLIEAKFPEDYPGLSAHIDRLATVGVDEKNAMTLVFERLTELRRKYAYKLIDAPTVTHAVILGRLADFYDRVLAGEGPDVCGQFAHTGSAALLELGLAEKYAEFMDQQSVAYFESVVGALETPQFAGIAAARDWSVVMDVIVKAGMPPAYIEAINSGRAGDPDLCPAYSALFRASGVLNTAEGKRVRADLAKNVAGY